MNGLKAMMRLALLSVLCVAAFGAAACGKDAPPPKPDRKFTTEPTTAPEKPQAAVKASASEEAAMLAATDAAGSSSQKGICHRALIIRRAGWGRVDVYGCPERPAGNLPVQPQSYAVRRLDSGKWEQSWAPDGGTPGCKVPHPYREQLGFERSDFCS